MKIGILEILVAIGAILSIIVGIVVFLLAMWSAPHLYTPEYVQANSSSLYAQWAWGGAGIAVYGLIFTLMCWLFVKSMAEFLGEKNLAKDERFKMMRQRGTMISYFVFMLVLIIVWFYEAFTNGPATDVIYWLIFANIIINAFSHAVSRYVLG
jgi:hypothetical protein